MKFSTTAVPEVVALLSGFISKVQIRKGFGVQFILAAMIYIQKQQPENSPKLCVLKFHFLNPERFDNKTGDANVF